PSLAFLSSSPRSYLAPHSFPTRRSSDLIHNIGLRLALHRAQVTVVPNLQQFIASGRTQCHGGQAFLRPLLHMAGEPGGITGRGRGCDFFRKYAVCAVPRLHVQTDPPVTVYIVHFGIGLDVVLSPEGNIRLAVPSLHGDTVTSYDL